MRSAIAVGRKKGLLLVIAVTLLAGCISRTESAGQPIPAPTIEQALADLAAEPTPTSAPAPVAAEPERFKITYGTETDNFGWLTVPSTPAPAQGFPVVVLVHGGFWRQQFGQSLMDDLAVDLSGRGYAVWNIEYRRVAGGDGGWPETGDDVVAAIEYVAQLPALYPIDPARVVTVGHSAGGHLALWALGQQQAVQVTGSVGLGAVVDLAYFSEARDLLGGTIDDVPDVYADAAPVLDPERVALVQGSADSIVPTASLEPAEAAGVPIVIIDNEDHFDLIDPASESWAAALDLIAAFLAQ